MKWMKKKKVAMANATLHIHEVLLYSSFSGYVPSFSGPIAPDAVGALYSAKRLSVAWRNVITARRTESARCSMELEQRAF